MCSVSTGVIKPTSLYFCKSLKMIKLFLSGFLLVGSKLGFKGKESKGLLKYFIIFLNLSLLIEG